MKILRRIKALMLGVPFHVKAWYNYAAHISKNDRATRARNFIVIFDDNGEYIECPKDGEYIKSPKKGAEVKYCYRGKLYRYKIVGSENESRNKDWMHEDDWLFPIIEFVGKVE